MNLTNSLKHIRWLPIAAGVILVSALVGCKRDNSRTYYAPKEETQPPPPAQAAAPAPANNQTPPQDMSVPPGLPALNWTLPAGWQEQAASGMRAASFTATGTNGQTADVSIIPLPISGHELELVNMWRQQVQLPPTTQADADKSVEPVTIAGDQGQLFQFASEQPMIDGKFPAGILVAELTRGQMSWFFKITGEESFVASQKQNFIQFLKSVTFSDQPTAPPHPLELPQTSSEPAPAENSGQPTWTVPSDWQSVSPSEFLLAEYSIAGANGAKAEVNVAQLGGEGGGALANINRWRRQLGLPPATEDDLSTMTSSLAASGGTATVVDMTGTDNGQKTRLVGVILPLGDQTWFYKLMGDEQTVAQQKDAFLKFVQSANYASNH